MNSRLLAVSLWTVERAREIAKRKKPKSGQSLMVVLSSLQSRRAVRFRLFRSAILRAFSTTQKGIASSLYGEHFYSSINYTQLTGLQWTRGQWHFHQTRDSSLLAAMQEKST